MAMTVSRAMDDLREEFLSRVFHGYPDHKKIWKADEIQGILHSSMYALAMRYFEEMEKKP